MSNSFTAFFENGWSDFLNWFGSAEASVVAEGKTIIDELVPVIKADLLADGSALITAASAGLATGGVGGIVSAAEAIIPAALQQGITLSKEAATTLASFISAKIAAAQAANTTTAVSGVVNKAAS